MSHAVLRTNAAAIQSIINPIAISFSTAAFNDAHIWAVEDTGRLKAAKCNEEA